MNDYRTYLDYSEKYLTLAIEEEGNGDINWLLFPATIMSWSAIESFVNNMLEDFSSLPADLFELHERALLLEQKIYFLDHGVNAGKFVLKGNEYRRLEEKILFLIWKFSTKNKIALKGDNLWRRFILFKDTRDKIVHPSRSKSVSLNIEKVSEFRETSISVVKLIAEKVWKKKLVI